MDIIAEQHDTPKEVIRAIADDLVNIISCSLVSGCKVRIEDFGSMQLTRTRSHLGEGAKVSFRTGRKLKMMANEARRGAEG